MVYRFLVAPRVRLVILIYLSTLLYANITVAICAYNHNWLHQNYDEVTLWNQPSYGPW